MKKKLMIIIPIVVLLLAGGAVFALAKMGKINIPGLTPKKTPAKKTAPPKVEVKKVEPPKKKVVPPAKPKATHMIDAEKGAKKLAKVWNELPVDNVLASIKEWKAPELARVIVSMEPEKAAALMAKLEPKRLDEVSREIQRQASLVPIEES
jgi:flagellar basal body-associated protein FliL